MDYCQTLARIVLWTMGLIAFVGIALILIGAAATDPIVAVVILYGIAACLFFYGVRGLIRSR